MSFQNDRKETDHGSSQCENFDKIKDVKSPFSEETLKILTDITSIVKDRGKVLLKNTNDNKSNPVGRTTEHVKKKYKITIDGKERFLCDTFVNQWIR